MIIKIISFIIASAIIVFISRKSLLNFRSHGFYRFFAFEFIIILFLMNVDHWFADLFSFYHIISWILLFVSAFFVIAGYHLLRSMGKADESRPEEHLYKIEKTTHLVTEGLYGYIRHPLYSSLLFLAGGIFFKAVSITGMILLIGAVLSLALTAKIEEKENCDYFGEAYKNYMQGTKMFIPYIW